MLVEQLQSPSAPTPGATEGDAEARAERAAHPRRRRADGAVGRRRTLRVERLRGRGAGAARRDAAESSEPAAPGGDDPIHPVGPAQREGEASGRRLESL